MKGSPAKKAARPVSAGRGLEDDVQSNVSLPQTKPAGAFALPHNKVCSMIFFKLSAR